MTGNSLRIGCVLGVEFRLDYPWFIVFGFVAVVQAWSPQPAG